MHDPTEGGVATGLWELADAAEVGLTVDAERIPVLADGATLCREFGLDPLGTIASGALLLAVTPTDAGILLHALAREGIDAAFIGRVVPRDAGVVLTRAGRAMPLPRFDQDEITRLFR
jgi:hydrogenase maturation factor